MQFVEATSTPAVEEAALSHNVVKLRLHYNGDFVLVSRPARW